MGKALYRVYRSKSFDELVGQDHITKTLKNSLEKGNLSHAYLFTGPRGVGKTSVARILAHAVNDLPYDQDTNSIDIIEIDAASNRRIDEIRELRDKVHIAPVSAKYKVYIIDEVHMLTKEAFNALLKTLEEPPAHVIFILATTEYHKLPETIISRCLRFTFRPISPVDLTSHLRDIADKESIKIDDGALQLIAQHGSGSFRDSISLLDQIRSHENQDISLEMVQQALGLASNETIDSILHAVKNGRSDKLVQELEASYSFGASEKHLAKQIASMLRGQLIYGDMALNKDDTIYLLHALIDVPASQEPRAQLELALLEISLRSSTISEPVKTTVEIRPKEQKTLAPTPLESPAKTIETVQSAEDPASLWVAVLGELKGKNNTLYGIARMAEAEEQEDVLVIKFKFGFHYKQVNDPKNKKLIADIVAKSNPEIKTVEVVHQPVKTDNSPKEKPKDEFYDSITNIFGPSEVLES